MNSIKVSIFFFLWANTCLSQVQNYSLDKGWFTSMQDSSSIFNPVSSTLQNKLPWQKVNLPHNWDDYGGARNLIHGNRHGTAWYRTQVFIKGTRKSTFFLKFEGIGTYATLYVNDKFIGKFICGRVTRTVEITSNVKLFANNRICIKAEHPSYITNEPWVCGGCSSEWGFSEGSQPFGIYRSITLEVRNKIRLTPYGIHVWNNKICDTYFVNNEIQNKDNVSTDLLIKTEILDKQNKLIALAKNKLHLQANEVSTTQNSFAVGEKIKKWSTTDPVLYKARVTIYKDGKIEDVEETEFGIRSISWPIHNVAGDKRFFINDKPLFINGVCEYEHLLGSSHAFTANQIESRISTIKNMGFNAFREAHQPHNLLYTKLCDVQGLLMWSQFSAHIWYDTKEFKENFLALLSQWIKERRNNPSVIMWGLQNESSLPASFAAACTQLIKQLDPTAIDQRVVTTCNGGEGTDWNVVQNWSGTYGGNPFNYGEDLASNAQLLNGEYGAWRSLGLHTEGSFEQKGIWSEDRMCQLLETKIEQAHSVQDSVCGQFLWVYNSHDNPGRKQPDEGFRLIDKIGPYNYKGLFTPWEEPLDAYFLYKSYYTRPQESPVLYIVSHTWPQRFTQPGKYTIKVYSNCDEVELFNGVNEKSLGRKKRTAGATSWIWDSVWIRTNILYAVGYVNGKRIMDDVVVLNHLPKADIHSLLAVPKELSKAEPRWNYLYRVNCGGNDYMDTQGEMWQKDVAWNGDLNTWGSVSWAQEFKGLNPYMGSQRESYDLIRNTNDQKLFQSFRYGRHKLGYRFPVVPGLYRVEFYFIEPWYGRGEAQKCNGRRIFDVGINHKIAIASLDIAKEAGVNTVLKKVFTVMVKDSMLYVDFPNVQVGQAVISAIAIAAHTGVKKIGNSSISTWNWDNIPEYIAMPPSLLPIDSSERPVRTFEAEGAVIKGVFDTIQILGKKGMCFKEGQSSIMFEVTTGLAMQWGLRIRYRNNGLQAIPVKITIQDSKGVFLKSDIISFVAAGEKWRLLNTATEGFINAGLYKIMLEGNLNGLCLDAIDLQ